MEVSNMSTYYIPEENFKDLEKKLNSIFNKCKKNGSEFHYENKGECFRDVKVIVNEQETTVPMKFIEIDVEGIAKINDWQFVGTIEHLAESQNIIRTITDVEVPERYFTAKCECEHCNSKRIRKDTYLVKNTITGEFKQIGGTCLLQYTNGISSEWAANLASFFKDLESTYSDYSGWPSMSYNRWINRDNILLYAIEVVKHFGYTKTYDDFENYNPSCTKAKVWDYYNYLERGDRSKTRSYIKDELPEHFDPMSEENKIKLDAMLKYFEENTEDNSYMRNLKTYANTEYLESRDLGYVVSMVPTYNRHLDVIKKAEARAAKQSEESAESTFRGEVGDKVTIEVDEMSCISSWDTLYGTTYLYKIVDKAGNVYVWYASRSYDIDSVSSLVGTVKGHDTFNGVKQTQLTRCKIVA